MTTRWVNGHVKEGRKEGRKEVFEVVEIVEVCRDYAGLSITRRY